jgi:hypothetical protein
MVRKYVGSPVVETLSPEQQTEVKKQYLVEDESETFNYLFFNPELIELLIEASIELEKYFSNAQKQLKYSIDPEYNDNEKLIVYISPNEKPETALNLYKSFQKNWWFQNKDRAKGNLLFTIRYR